MNLKDYIKKVGRLRREIWNAAVHNIAKESIAIAKSWTFGSGSIAEMWEYKVQMDGKGLINNIVIRNLFQRTGAPAAKEIWGMLENGRRRYLIETSNRMWLPIVNQFTGKFGVPSRLVLMPKKEGFHPLERATEHFEDRFARFTAEIKEARWGNAKEKSKVQAIPNLYKNKTRSESAYLKSVPKTLAYGSYLYKKDRPSERKSTKSLYKSFLKAQEKNK
jgi:hypothetical protein